MSAGTAPEGRPRGAAVPGAAQGAEGATSERAAGGLVWRQLPTGAEIVLVHRPAYDDWAFPKGKVKASESDEQAALREVYEETGLRCRLGLELPTTTYPRLGRLKTVRYWAMTPEPGPAGAEVRSPAPSPEGASEVDEASWVPLEAARQRLSYVRDVVVLDALDQLAPLAGRSKVGGQEDGGVLESEPQREEAQYPASQQGESAGVPATAGGEEPRPGP